jgi:hypothetical protein
MHAVRVVRLMIVMAVALLVPLQGLATVAAGVCMALGHHDAPAAASHHHGDSGHHDHGADDASGEAHCPPCVACCAAAAISSSDRGFVPEAPVFSAVSVPPPLISGILPDKLDRPPLAL